MLADILEIGDLFSEKIIGYMNWKHDIYPNLDYLDPDMQKVVPVYQLESSIYVPALLTSNANKPPYIGMTESWSDIIKLIPKASHCTFPVKILQSENRLFGLIPYIHGKSLNTIYFEKEYDVDNDFKGMINACMEYHNTGFIHLDLNAENFVRDENKEIHIVDISLALPHSRPLLDYRDERAVDYHWSPEILEGGNITEKSAVFSLGKTFIWLLRSPFGFENYVKSKEYNDWKDTIESCTQKDPRDRPYFKELLFH